MISPGVLVTEVTDQACRDAQDAKRDIQVAVSPSLVTTAYYAPAALRPCRFATPSHARCRLRSTPANGLTACRMRLHMPFAGLGPVGPNPLRPYARADAFRGLRALASLSMARSEGKHHLEQHHRPRAIYKESISALQNSMRLLPLSIWHCLRRQGKVRGQYSPVTPRTVEPAGPTDRARSPIGAGSST